MITEGEMLWKPSPKQIAESNLTRFTSWLKKERQLDFSDYNDLWSWSVEHLADFWQSIWEYFEVESSTSYDKVLGKKEMPGAEWFPGASVNFAQHVLRQERTNTDALFFFSELSPQSSINWEQLAGDVRILATQLRALGIKPGDRVVAYMPNIPETVIAMLATTSIGAIWTSSSPDFGLRSVLDRYTQIKPKLMFCVGGYRYGGKDINRKTDVGNIIAHLESLEHVIYLPYLDKQDETLPVEDAILWHDLLNYPPVPRNEFQFEQVPFNHPLWILFSSGTTGLPKPIVQGHGPWR